jgi:hypothetical protein
MVRKLMALGSVMFVTGLVTTLTISGCSDADPGAEPDAGEDARTDVRPPPSEPDPDDDAGACPASVPLTAADIDEEIGWKPAAKAAGACSAEDLAVLEANFEDTTIESYFDLGKNLTETCRTCAIAKDTDDAWGPIVGLAASNGQTGFINFGACFGAVVAEPCGKAVQYEELCYNVACDACATTQSEQQRCVSAAGEAGMCKEFAATTQGQCPGLSGAVAQCGTLIDAVKTLCGGTSLDAGDAGG